MHIVKKAKIWAMAIIKWADIVRGEQSNWKDGHLYDVSKTEKPCKLLFSEVIYFQLHSPPIWLIFYIHTYMTKLECGPMPNVMVALPNIGGALCSILQSLADAHY